MPVCLRWTKGALARPAQDLVGLDHEPVRTNELGELFGDVAERVALTIAEGRTIEGIGKLNGAEGTTAPHDRCDDEATKLWESAPTVEGMCLGAPGLDDHVGTSLPERGLKQRIGVGGTPGKERPWRGTVHTGHDELAPTDVECMHNTCFAGQHVVGQLQTELGTIERVA